MAVRISSDSGSQILAAKSEAASIARRSLLDLKRQASAKNRAARVRPQVESTQPIARASAKNRVTLTRPQTESTQRTLARAQAQEVSGQIRERALARVDVLVGGMEVLAERISSKKVSSSQRSVLMSRFNDLQRQVNRIDGIVGGEGRETQGQKSLNGSPTEVRGQMENRQEAIPTSSMLDWPAQPEIRAVRQKIQSERRTVASTRRQAQQTIERELQNLRPEAGKPEPEQVQKTLKGIRSQGLASVGDGAGNNMVDLQV